MTVYHVICVQHLPSGSSADACGVAAPLCGVGTASADVNNTLSTEHTYSILSHLFDRNVQFHEINIPTSLKYTVSILNSVLVTITITYETVSDFQEFQTIGLSSHYCNVTT